MKEVVILAKGKSRTQCQFDCEIWGVSNVWESFKDDPRFRVDKIFYFDNDPLTRDTWVPWVKENLKVPVVSCHEWADEPFPFDEIAAKPWAKPPCRAEPFYSNSLCYMLAYAIYLGYDKISLYGCDMVWGSEYVLEKGGMEHWIGVAQGRGIEVYIPPGGHLCLSLSGEVYGKEDESGKGMYQSVKTIVCEPA